MLRENSPDFTEKVEFDDQVQAILNQLNARDRAVITEYFGLRGAPKTHQEIANELGCSRQCSQQRLQRALRKLRKTWRK